MYRTPRSGSLVFAGKMNESVEVGGLTPTPNPFLVVDFYNQNRACLLPEKGLPAPGPYSTPLRTPLWNGSNHCRYRRSFPIVGVGGGRWAFHSQPGGCGSGRGGGLYPSLSLVFLAETWVPLLDNWTPRRTLSAMSVVLGLRNFGGFLPPRNICSFLHLLEGK